MAVTVIFDRVIGLEFDKSISSFLCTRSIGVLCLGEAVIVECHDPQLNSLAKFPSSPRIFDALLDFYQFTQSTHTRQHQIKLEISFIEAPYTVKGKKERQAIKLRDSAGSIATLLLFDEQTGVYGLCEGDELIITGCSVTFKEARFLVYLGPNSSIEKGQVYKPEEYAVVPDLPDSVEAMIDAIVHLPEGSEQCLTFDALLTQFNPEGSIFAECADCKTWQKLLRPSCRACKGGSFVKHRFDVRLSLCDESGQWTDLPLPDRILRGAMNMHPDDMDLKTKAHNWLLSWVKVTVSAKKHLDMIYCNVISLQRTDK